MDIPVITERDAEDSRVLEALEDLDERLAMLMSDIGGDKASGDAMRSSAADRRLRRLRRDRKALGHVIDTLRERLAGLVKPIR